MPDYISRFSGEEIDQAIQKSKDINKTAGEINTNLDFTANLKTGIDNLAENEIISKGVNGSVKKTGIMNEDNKIFFPKDGRFPSGSIDVGPASTISENGGWLQYKADTLDKNYLFLDYEIDSNGSKRPIYWERAAQENNVVINQAANVDMNLTSFVHIPITDSQINSLYLYFSQPQTNVLIEISSLITNKPVKYIPNENAWRIGTGGVNINQGIVNILGDTPISALTSYQLKFTFKVPVVLKGNGNIPYIQVDRQLITPKGVLLQGEGTGGADTPEQIRDKLQSLTGANRLRATALQGIHEVLQLIDGGYANSSFDSILDGGGANGN